MGKHTRYGNIITDQFLQNHILSKAVMNTGVKIERKGPISAAVADFFLGHGEEVIHDCLSCVAGSLVLCWEGMVGERRKRGRECRNVAFDVIVHAVYWEFRLQTLTTLCMGGYDGVKACFPESRMAQRRGF